MTSPSRALLHAPFGRPWTSGLASLGCALALAGCSAAALALLAVGVPRDTVVRDYLLTNDFSAEHTKSTLRLLRVVSLFRTDPEDVRPLFEARREYLESAFGAIDEKFGSTEAWLRQGLGASDALLARVRANLLE